MPTHWKKLTNPDYIGAYAFEPGEEKLVTIDRVCEEQVTGMDGKQEACTVAHFREDVKPLILNATNCKAISRLYGTPYIEEWAGKALLLRVQRVKAFGEIVDAVRVKPERPTAPVCAGCGETIDPYGGRSAVQLAAYTRNRYGRALCAACAAATKRGESHVDRNAGAGAAGATGASDL